MPNERRKKVKRVTEIREVFVCVCTHVWQLRIKKQTCLRGKKRRLRATEEMTKNKQEVVKKKGPSPGKRYDRVMGSKEEEEEELR